jgi:hypothetical protein
VKFVRTGAGFLSLGGCVAVLAGPDGGTDGMLLDDVRAPCSAKVSTGTAKLTDLDGTFARIVGDGPTAPDSFLGTFGDNADVVGDLDGDGCDDLAIVVTEWDATFDTVTASYILLFRGPLASGVFSASEADSRVDMKPGTSGSMPARSAGDTNVDGRGASGSWCRTICPVPWPNFLSPTPSRLTSQAVSTRMVMAPLTRWPCTVIRVPPSTMAPFPGKLTHREA